MDVKKKKQKGILDYIFQFAGEYKGAYIKSVVFAVVGVAFSLAPYALMGDMVKKLLSGEQDFNIYLREGLVMARVFDRNRQLYKLKESKFTDKSQGRERKASRSNG